MKFQFFSQKFKAALARCPNFTFALFLIVVTAGVFSGGVWSVAGIGGAVILFGMVWIMDGEVPRPAGRSCGAMAVVALAVMLVVQFSIHAAGDFLVRMATARHGFSASAGCFPALPCKRAPKTRRYLCLFAAGGGSGGTLLGDQRLSSGGVFLQMVRGPDAVLTRYNRGLVLSCDLGFSVDCGDDAGWRKNFGKK